MTACSLFAGYYQPAGPLIKESSADAERALARYHPPHYHPPHPPVLQQYGPYYPAELCYGRYYRPPGPYHIPPPQPDAQMVGVGSEPYPPQYYGTPPCYQHSPQRIPYVEYRGCPCPLNACPKNVLIGPATGKAPTGGGPADVPSALAPPGGAFRLKVRAGALESAADNHGSGKDPPLEPEPPGPPMAADAPHPCPLPAIGGASPKREMYDVRENLRLTADVPGPTEALGPPSPARGACAPQPPPSAPRRARLGKAMARRSLAGEDTGLLISNPQSTTINQDVDDDVLAISPPICAPIDLSSSDERSTPLVDVKKENEGPTYATSRKTDTQALREHNSTTALIDALDSTDAAKAVKRRYSKPKLEIEMKDVQLEDACKTNGIGEHVKLQKRRKVSGDQTNVPRIETITKEPKKKSTQNKRMQKTSPGDKKAHKRKSDTIHTEPKNKKLIIDKGVNEDLRFANIAAVPDDDLCMKPKTKSALLLDNLIKKNSIDRLDAKASDAKLNPAELFLPPTDNVSQNCTKKTLNINNNIVENSVPVNGVQPKTIAAVSQLIVKKLANKTACKIEKVDSKIMHNLKSVLSAPTEAINFKEVNNTSFMNGETNIEKSSLNICIEDEKPKIVDIKEKCEQKDISVSVNESNSAVDAIKLAKSIKPVKTKPLPNSLEPISKSLTTGNVDESQTAMPSECKVKNSANTRDKFEDIDKSLPKRSKVYTDKTNGEFKSKNVENLVKLLTSKKLASKATELLAPVEQKDEEITKEKDVATPKRCKLVGEKTTGESKSKNVEKVVKLLVSKKTVIKTDEASLVVEDACSSPVPNMKKTRRRRSGGRRVRRVAAPLIAPDLQPRTQPKWSNGWNWDGEDYISKVYQNNDSRLDRTARCWPRMTHLSGDRVSRGDCVLLRASLKPTNEAQPYVARIASLWEDPENGEMMVSLVWYYRPEHTERGRQATDAPDEVFASRHRDANSVACIEDKCYVLTFNEYCRYKKRLKAAEEGIVMGPSIVPPLPASEVTPLLAPNDTKLPPTVSPELVLFCRKIYDFRSKKIHVPNK
ncbi:jg5004 [Pararge aegeria aegeria]|uniref:Jg5004 protein n=1 Tax=Pararge aegeria aegeria TaxID=348720 RepID=A0A8S4QZX9_9NEOP|nr:jg5004 [Pararge aegeria aegeria]